MDLSDLMAEEEQRLLAAAQASLERDVAKIRQRLDEALQKDIAAGIRDADGNWLEVEPDEDDLEEEEDDLEEDE